MEFGLFETLKKSISVPLVVHGGTGLKPEVFWKLISLGAAKINVSTAIKIAYCQGMRQYMEKNPNQNNPLKLDSFVFDAVKQCVIEHMNLFRCAGRAWL